MTFASLPSITETTELVDADDFFAFSHVVSPFEFSIYLWRLAVNWHGHPILPHVSSGIPPATRCREARAVEFCQSQPRKAKVVPILGCSLWIIRKPFFTNDFRESRDRWMGEVKDAILAFFELPSHGGVVQSLWQFGFDAGSELPLKFPSQRFVMRERV
jgi:hypothetical protein